MIAIAHGTPEYPPTFIVSHLVHPIFALWTASALAASTSGCAYNFDTPFTDVATPSADGGDEARLSIPDAGSDVSAQEEEASTDVNDGGVEADAPGPLGEPCGNAAYAGWNCLPMAIHSDLHGVDFHVTVRWNYVSSTPTATALWVIGNNGTGTFRVDDPATIGVQDQLAQVDGIRSVEVTWTDPLDGTNPNTGGYWRAPRQGYPDTSAAYANLVGQLVGLGIASGQWITHIGLSNGAMLGATALARHGLGSLVKRYIFLSAPFASSLGDECRNTAGYAAMPATAISPIRSLIDLWNGWSASCQEAAAAPESATYEARSPLPAGTLSFPDVSLLFILGWSDESGAWMQQSNEAFAERVQAGKKLRFVIKDGVHDLLGGADSTAPWLPAVLSLVYSHARLAPLTDPDPEPRITFSHTLDGPADTAFFRFDHAFGRVEGIGANAAACMDGPGSLLCSASDQWANMPNSDWSYSSATETWRAQLVLAGYPVGEYRGWWRNQITQQVTPRAEFHLLP